MYTLFLTGGIGSGKSAACAHLAARGARVISLDVLAHDVLGEGAVKAELAQRFGAEVLGLADDDALEADPAPDWDALEVDRAALARAAFADDESTAALDAITHPRIMERLGEMLVDGGSCAPGAPACPLTVVEVPLLEAAGSGLADEVMTLVCPAEVRRERARGRGMAPADFDARDAAQITDERRCQLADAIVDNSGSPEALAAQLDAWWDARAGSGWAPLSAGGPGAPAHVPPAPACALHSPAVAFVGRHNSGKTTLVERIIAELVARGADVGSVKHHGHRGFEIDVPGKDSWRHRRAGASEVAIASPDQFALIRSIEDDMRTEDVVAAMRPHNVIVVEGFRHSSIPAVEVMRAANPRDVACARAFASAPAGEPFAFDPAGLGVDADRLPDEHTVAVATDMPCVMRAARERGMWAFDVNDAAGVAAFVESRIMGRTA